MKKLTIILTLLCTLLSCSNSKKHINNGDLRIERNQQSSNLIVNKAIPSSFASSPGKLKIWINAFIPKDIPGATTTVERPTPFFSNTVISFLGDYYLTDQRAFSSDINAKHRMQTVVDIDFVSKTITGSSNCNETIRLNSDFVLACQKTANANGLKITNTNVGQTPDGKEMYNFSLKGGSSNPCVPYVPGALVPEINWSLNVTVNRDPATDKVIVVLSGIIEPFPNFEMYGSLDNGAPVDIFKHATGLAKLGPWFLPNLPLGYSMPADVSVSEAPKEIN